MSKASQERLKAVVQGFVAVATSGGKIQNFHFSKEMADAGFLATFRPSLSTQRQLSIEFLKKNPLQSSL